MRYLYGEADEKYIKIPVAKKKVKNPLSSYKFHMNSVIQSNKIVKEYDKMDVPLVFKCSPDSLLNLCVQVVDQMPLPRVYNWTIEDNCKWLRQCGYKQYQVSFLKLLKYPSFKNICHFRTPFA